MLKCKDFFTVAEEYGTFYHAEKSCRVCSWLRKGRCYANEKAKTGCNPTAFNSNNFDYCGTFVPAGKRAFVSKEKPVETKADGGSLTVSYIDVGQGDATLIQKGNFSMLIDAREK